MHDWAYEEMQGADFGDVRRVRRVAKTLGTLAEHLGLSVPSACESSADTQAVYRLWSSPGVTPQAMYQQHFRRTKERASAHDVVLVLQDGSSLDFTGLKATTNLGYLESEYTRGLMIHPSLVATPDGRVLGLVDMEVWARPVDQLGKREQRREKPIEEKESFVWLKAWANAQKQLPEEVAVIGIADQEADMFELFAAPRREGAHLIIRATGDRSVKHPARLLGQAIRQFEPCGTTTIEVARRLDRAPREAKVTVRCAPLSMLPPAHGVHGQLPAEVPMWAVLVEEESPPAGVEAIRWLLLTTLRTDSYDDATRIVAYYRRRWLIEQYFFVLKQGCKIESLQLEDGERIRHALATYSVVAWRQLHLMTEARHDPHGPADEILAAEEWQALYARFYPRLKMPVKPPTKREAVRLIARLGGFLARKGDGDPGVKTIWQGLVRLVDIATGYRLAAQRG